MERQEKLEKVKQLAREYKQMGYHCSEATIRAVPAVLGIDISEDVVKAATSFFGGGGGTKDRCGIIESCLIIISMLYGRLDPETSDQDIRDLSEELMKRYQEKFSSIYCRDIKPPEVEKFGEDFGCQRVYEEGAALVTELLLDANEILKK